MPAKDFSQPVFQADANAASDWGSVGAGGAVDFRASAELERGIDIDLGLMAIANLDASFSQFLAADLQGSAQAQASVRAQIELPLNLFDEVGVAVRLQAIAELAAGVRLGVGLALGDFLELAGENLRGGDISGRLLRIFIEESELQIGFFAKAALSAQAYANLVVTGCALADPITGTQPGFTIAAGAGAGLKAGAGFQVFGTAKIASFSRLVARSADAIVDETVSRLAHELPSSAANARAVLFGVRPAFKIALRLAFELGEQFARPGLTHDAAAQESLSTRGLQVVLEELQRAICEGAVRAASSTMVTLLAPVQAAGSAWDACRAERHALADLLETAPHPFADADGTQRWLELMSRAADFAAAVASVEPKLVDAAAMGWAALKLATRIHERVERASAGVSVIGVPPRQIAAAFTGPMGGAVPPRIDASIRATLAASGVSVSGPLDYTHLARYLAQKAIVDVIIQANPGLATFLDDVRGSLAPDIETLVQLVLANASSFPVGTGTNADPVAALTVIANGVRAYVSNRLTAAFRSQLEAAFAGQDDLRVYFDEVLVPTLDFALVVITRETVGWATSGRSPKAVTEALSAVLLKLLSRSLVVIADTTSAYVQEQMSVLLVRAAAAANGPNGLVEVLANNPAVGFAADEIGELVHDALTVAAEVFGPLSSERRTRIRGLLYDVLDPAGATPGDQLLQQLENPGLIPNEAALRELAQELGSLATERFVLFVEGLVMRILARIADAWLAALDAAIAVAEAFLAGIAQAISLIAQRLDEIARTIQALATQIAAAAAGALGDLDRMLDSFSSSSGRTRFVNEIASSVSSRALSALEDNWAYQNLVPGGVRRDVRSRVRQVVRGLLDASPFEEFLDAIGAIRDQLHEILEDARNLDRNAPLAPQITEMLIARLAVLVADRYGTVRIRVSFTFDWNTPLGRVHHDFDLGRIRVRVGDVAEIIRPIARGFGEFEAAVASLADRVRTIFDAEEQSEDLRDEEQAVRAERGRLDAIASEQQGGPKAVIIERPVQLQAVRADTRVVISLEGFSPTVLSVDENTPQRLFILLNGETVNLDSFRVETRIAPIPVADAGGRSEAMAVAIARHSRDASRTAAARDPQVRFVASSRATLGSGVRNIRTLGMRPGLTPATLGVRISGRLPLELLTPGLNTLTVVAVAGPGERVTDTVGFMLAQAPKAPGFGRRVPPPVGLKGLPKGLPGALTRGVMVPAERRRVASALARVHPTAPIKPLARIVTRSPLLAQRFGIERPAELRPHGTLRLTSKRESFK